MYKDLLLCVFENNLDQNFRSSTLKFINFCVVLPPPPSSHSHVQFEWRTGHVDGNQGPYTRGEGGWTTIGCLHTYGSREGPHPRPRNREKYAPGHAHEERKARMSTTNRVFLSSSLSLSPPFAPSPPLFNFWYRQR